MKTRNQCKICGASGIIRTPKDGGHFSFSKDSLGMPLDFARAGAGKAIRCPHCKPDKYNPQTCANLRGKARKARRATA